MNDSATEAARLSGKIPLACWAPLTLRKLGATNVRLAVPEGIQPIVAAANSYDGRQISFTPRVSIGIIAKMASSGLPSGVGP